MLLKPLNGAGSFLVREGESYRDELALSLRVELRAIVVCSNQPSEKIAKVFFFVRLFTFV